ncbi:hypothetical protein G6F66_014826 [Rhizopus arrhizus]|nr:hypothetical protein G6F66_014826 [Rhizopus arrhizus]
MAASPARRPCRRVGILEDVLDFLAQALAARGVHRKDVLAVVAHRARGRGHELLQRLANGGFAAARFAHQRHRFTAANGEVQRLHRAVRFGAGAELHAQAFNRQ